MIGSSDSDSDDAKRVVRSAKDRRFDELKATGEELRVSQLCYWAYMAQHLLCALPPSGKLPEEGY